MIKHRMAVACLLAGLSAAAFAAHGGSPAGGMSAGHMSAAGLANTNGPAAADRDKGLERAADRRSAEGASHEQAGRPHGKKRGHRAPTPLAGQQH